MSITDGTVLRVVAGLLWSDANVNQNVFNCVITGAGAPWDEADVVADCLDWLDDMYANLTTGQSDELDGNSITVYEYDALDDDWDEIGSDAWVYDPNNVGEQLPRGVAALVRLWTTDADVQGKKYISGITEASLVDGLFSAGLVTSLLAFAADWYLPFVGTATGGTFTPGIWSVVGTVFKAAIDHVATSTVPAYQRRRKRTVGI